MLDGAGPNKLVAKLACEAAKPRASKGGRAPLPGPGRSSSPPRRCSASFGPYPVGALWGVGPASAERLRLLGIATVGDLATVPVAALVSSLGRSNGALLHELAWGRDERPVTADRAPKSIGHEETYATDIVSREELERRLISMADLVAGRVREHGMVARTIVLKLRYPDFTTITRSQSSTSPQSSGPAFWTAGKALLSRLELRNGARLLGISASGLMAVEASPESSSSSSRTLEGARQAEAPSRAGTGRARPWTLYAPASARPP